MRHYALNWSIPHSILYKKNSKCNCKLRVTPVLKVRLTPKIYVTTSYKEQCIFLFKLRSPARTVVPELIGHISIRILCPTLYANLSVLVNLVLRITLTTVTDKLYVCAMFSMQQRVPLREREREREEKTGNEATQMPLLRYKTPF